MELFDAVDRYSALTAMSREGLQWTWNEWMVGDRDAATGCFMSHYLIWKECVNIGSEVLIAEHDAIILQPLPELSYTGALYLGEIAWGVEEELQYQRSNIGVSPLRTKNFRGTFAYVVKPSAPQAFLRRAREQGAQPVDEFLCIQTFPFLQQLNPGVARHCSDFSSISNYPLGDIQTTQQDVWTEYSA